ncbi:MAG: DUF1800 domain-containing protein [Fimbriimonadaceae bacterium]|nr:DUF1800 domain-containing protein [Fimbriimonadaceae bacterium]
MKLQSEREKIAHLLRRFGLGASEAELDYYGEKGLSGAIDRLFAYESVEEPLKAAPDEVTNDGKIPNIREVQGWWMMKLLTTRRPLQEKITLFWHDHFATSAQKVNQPLMMIDQIDILRQNCLGKFRTLIGSVSKDPAMLFWLDNQYNVKGKPNENFAREVMELFTLGIGNYTEKDILEAARAFTGWTIGVGRTDRQPPANANKPPRRGQFVFRPGQHDSGLKEVLGNKGPFDGDDILNILCDHPQTARYITTKMWEWFAYPEPEKALIDKLSSKFRSSALDIKALVRAIMESPEFYSDKAVRAIYKNPVDFAASAVRQLGVGETLAQNVEKAEPDKMRGAMAPAIGLSGVTKNMGMDLLFPPDVAGWDGGQNWISSATMVERIKLADRLFGTAQGGRGGVNFRYPAMALLASDPTPEGATKKLQSIFDVELSAAKQTELIESARKACNGRITAQNANQTAAAVTRLIFASPEFQMM